MSLRNTIAFLSFLFFSVPLQNVIAQDNVLTVERLTIQDIEPTIKHFCSCRTSGKQVSTIYGVFQQENEATILYKCSDGENDSIRIIRLNSGKWIYPRGCRWITK